ncbi:dihydrolipoamide dehydrogenase [Devosia yakushimensis]|uniref:Dihydrolipoamide dehydrogenase n=1 Tax=Devosia yakushimensis TaxID=470028 RepID=A0ABQ5UIE5_9HYPH|nr:NAD(P)/FAD-dependent oxidoreductase [Devosia yakushimensis]GLQ11187.1 dihydrolipoamide dehydrogenase [Devosia yakushimensis]
MADLQNPDLCIIGAGALGIGLALRARRLGANVMLVDRGAEEPGDPAQGRLVATAFATSASRAQLMHDARPFGLAPAEPKPSFKAIGERARALAASTAPRDAASRLTALGIDCRAGQPIFTGRQTFKLGETTIRAGHIILATGARPVIPTIPGLDEATYFTPDTIAANSRKLTHLVVIGSDASAIELAQAHRRLGAAVTLVPQGDILPGFDREQVAILLRQLTQEGLEIAEGASVTRIVPRRQGTGVDLTHADGSDHSLDASHLLISMGRIPDFDGLVLDRAKVRFDKARPGFLQLNTDGRTSNSRIHAVGGAAGQGQSHASARYGAAIVDRLFGNGSSRPDPALIPLLLQTEPGLATIGLVEGERPLPAGTLVLRASFAENDMARALGQTHGAAKLIAGGKGQILGASIIGPGAGEAIAMLALAMDRAMPAQGLADLVLPHPSFAAILSQLGEAFLAARQPGAWQKRSQALRKLLG